MKSVFAVAALAVLAPYAAAQEYPARPNAADPAAVVPPARYESAFSGYTSYREQDPRSWRELNDEVARIGGHARMLSGAAPAGHDVAESVPAKPAPGEPAGQRSAPQAPQAGHKGH